MGVTGPRGSIAVTARPVPGLAHQLSQLARSLHAAPDRQQLLDHIVGAAVREIPGADDAGIILLDGGRPSTAAATAGAVTDVHLAQYRAGLGPGLLAARHRGIVRVDSLSEPTDWPAYAAAARAAGIESSLSIHLFVHDGGLGALTLYGRVPRAFDRDAERVGLLFASHVSIALATSQQAAHLATGLASREVIGQAQGILIERFKITAAQAFDLLITASQHSNRKLRDVAAHLVETGEVPGRLAVTRQRRTPG